MQPPGALGTLPVVDGVPGAGLPGADDGGGAGVTLDEGVVVVVVVELGDLLPPPHPTAKTSTAAPPNSAIAVLASDFIRISVLHPVVRPLPIVAHRDPYRVGASVPACRANRYSLNRSSRSRNSLIIPARMETSTADSGLSSARMLKIFIRVPLTVYLVGGWPGTRFLVLRNTHTGG